MKNVNGFTFMQLMVVTAVIMLIAAFSYPMYEDHVMRAKRTHAEETLLDISSQLEHYYSLYDTYATASLDRIKFVAPQSKNGYEYIIQNQTERTYIISAIPQGAQEKDINCAALTLNSVGDKGITGPGSVEMCWDLK
ncbi:MAG: type IV pilin protein [Gammaproteobacteria bacterium]|nr:type IV pilin protein [Gammaproteobacteria bacterium]